MSASRLTQNYNRKDNDKGDNENSINNKLRQYQDNKCLLFNEFCRVGVFTFNVASGFVEDEQHPRFKTIIKNLLDENDIVFFVLQEVKMDVVSVLNLSHVMYKKNGNFAKWEGIFIDALNSDQNHFNDFTLYSSISGSIMAFLFVDTHKFHDVVLDWQTLNLGFANILSNKSAIGVHITFKNSQYNSLCIIGTHLPSDLNKNERRIDAVNQIMTIMKFSQGTLEIPSIKNVIFCGDLNFRIEMNFDEIINYLQKKEYSYLIQFDQLLKSKLKIFSDFNEAKLNYTPTYKYIKGTNSFDNERNPSFTDRILYRGSQKLLKHKIYHDVIFSDHRPVSSCFMLFDSSSIIDINWNDLRLTYLGEELKSFHSIKCGKIAFYEKFNICLQIQNFSVNQARICVRNNRIGEHQQLINLDPATTEEFDLNFFSNHISNFSNKNITENIILVLNESNSNTFHFSLTYELKPTNVFGKRIINNSSYNDSKLSYPIDLFLSEYEQIMMNNDDDVESWDITPLEISKFVRKIENYETNLNGINTLILHRIIWIYLFSYPDNVMVFNDVSQSEPSNSHFLVNLEPLSDINFEEMSTYQPPHHNIMFLFELWRKMSISIHLVDVNYRIYLLHMMYPLITKKTYLKTANRTGPVPRQMVAFLADYLLNGDGPEFVNG